MLRLYVTITAVVSMTLMRGVDFYETKREQQRNDEEGAALETIILVAGLAALALAVVAGIGVAVKKYLAKI